VPGWLETAAEPPALARRRRMPTSAARNCAGPLRMNKRQILGSRPRSVASCRRCGRRRRKSSDSLFVGQVLAPLARHHHRASVVAILRQGRQLTLNRYSPDGDLDEAEIGAADGVIQAESVDGRLAVIKTIGDAVIAAF
jgi:hypothetical protein